MLISELIEQTVAGRLHLDFIESTVTALHGSLLSTLRGSGHSDPADGLFHYNFHPRAPLPPDWLPKGGHMDPVNQAGRTFRAEGVERGSAAWTGTATDLRFINTTAGPAIHASVKEWTRTDARAVQRPFMRVLIPGRLGCPVTVRHDRGVESRVASAHAKGISVEFRDYGNYTEVCAVSSGRIPHSFASSCTTALENILERQVQWVCREHHVDDERLTTVRSLSRESDRGPARHTSYTEFWQQFSAELQRLL